MDIESWFKMPLVLLVKRAESNYQNQWEAGTLKMLHTHLEIKNVIEKEAENRIFVQRQDFNSATYDRKIVSSGVVDRIVAKEDGKTFEVWFKEIRKEDVMPKARSSGKGYYVY